jgi:DNA-binding response OmpR family regulator
VPAKILVVDDAAEVTDLLTAVLATAGHEVRIAETGDGALAQTRAWQPQVVVLDLGLPGMDGIEVCRQLRTFSDAYVLMLTGRTDEVDRIVGLTVGADDYVTKPFSPREISARVEALLRRARPAAVAAPEAAAAPASTGRRFGALLIDPEAREVTIDDQHVELTRTEFQILDALTENARRVLTREQLRERVWGGGWFGDDHAVDVHVSNLRRKLAAAGAAQAVATVRGVGYRLAPALAQAVGQ